MNTVEEVFRDWLGVGGKAVFYLFLILMMIAAASFFGMLIVRIKDDFIEGPTLKSWVTGLAITFLILTYLVLVSVCILACLGSMATLIFVEISLFIILFADEISSIFD